MSYAYPIPANRSNAAYFYATGLGGQLGVYPKSMPAKTMLTVDYSGVVGVPNPPNVGGSVGITNISFVLGTQTLPPLVVSNPVLQAQMNVLTFVLSGGFAGVQYELSINATLSNGVLRTDVLTIDIPPPYEDDCACSSCGCSPCECRDTIDDLQDQMASLATDDSIFGTNFVRYYVSYSEPAPASLFDKWYNPATGVISNYVSNGIASRWVPEFNNAGGTITGPVIFDNDVTIEGTLDATLDMGTFS